MIVKNQQINFLLSLIAVFLLDILLFILFRQKIAAFVGIFFIREILREEQNWRTLMPVMLLYFFECFIFLQPFGLPLFYAIPLLYAGHKSRRIMHFSKMFYVCLLLMLVLAENGVSYGAGNHMISSAMIMSSCCLNLILMLIWSYLS